MASRLLLGPAFKALRVAHKIPQGDAALRLDISQGYLSNLEKGVKQPGPVLLHQMADVLGVGVEAISYVLPSDVAERVPA